jgi:putative methyltransferase (TIGR04325 family)
MQGSFADLIPVILFAYARPDHLRRTLACLRADQVPLIYAFSDGPRSLDKEPLVAEVREILRAINWSEVILCERQENLGLGRSVRAGVTEVLGKHDICIVFEDDLICVSGTYGYLSAALRHYRDDPKVMSVTGWTHPRTTPRDVIDQPYFDGRAECWVWGTWARAWQGMERDAQTLMEACQERGIDIYRYGADLPEMARRELRSNIWAVRFLYHHILNSGLCLRPPHSLVEHIGFDALATNASSAGGWSNPSLRPCPPLPDVWPTPVEHSECVGLWQLACGWQPGVLPPLGLAGRVRRKLSRGIRSAAGGYNLAAIKAKQLAKPFVPPQFVHGYRALRQKGKKLTDRSRVSGLCLSGDYHSWDAALADSTGYDAENILKKTTAALLKVKNGEAVYERDSVLFDEIQYAWPLLAGLMWAAVRCGGSLNVLDFGGSLGSTYFQNRAFFTGLRQVRWNIVEQPRQVDAGKRWFEDDRLRFYTRIEECLADAKPQVIVLSSALQYLEQPYQTLDKLLRSNCDYLIVDRTPFWDGPKDLLCVQHVPAEIYPASYPSWIFSARRFRSCLNHNWKIIAEFDNLDRLPGPVEFSYRGMIATRRESP